MADVNIAEYIQKLKDKNNDPKLRAAAAEALGEINYSKVSSEDLKEVFNALFLVQTTDTNQLVHEAATGALKKIQEAAKEKVEENKTASPITVDSFYNEIMKCLNSASVKDRLSAIQLLSGDYDFWNWMRYRIKGKYEEAADELLVSTVSRDKPLLDSLDSTRFTEIIRKCLGDKNEDVFYATCITSWEWLTANHRWALPFPSNKKELLISLLRPYVSRIKEHRKEQFHPSEDFGDLSGLSESETSKFLSKMARSKPYPFEELLSLLGEKLQKEEKAAPPTLEGKGIIFKLIKEIERDISSEDRPTRIKGYATLSNLPNILPSDSSLAPIRNELASALAPHLVSMKEDAAFLRGEGNKDTAKMVEKGINLVEEIVGKKEEKKQVPLKH